MSSPANSGEAAVREGDPGGWIRPGLSTWVPFPSRSYAALGRE